MKHLQDIEDQLTKLVISDKKTWVSFYKLLKEVEQGQLYKQSGLNSFTAWVKTFSKTNKIHESVIWARKKAGKIYETYEERQAQKGITVAKIEDIDVSADSLVLLEKISNKSPELGAKMVDKVLNNELTREDLRQTYRTLRDTGKEAASKSTQLEKVKREETDGSDSINSQDEDEKTNDTEMTTLITSDLMRSIKWLYKFGEEKEMTNIQVTRRVGEFKAFKRKMFKEFSVFTGSSRKSRRIDVMVAENHYAEVGEINLHGVEVKVSAGDLKRDQKYTEYTEFVDYVWLAIPEKLLDIALEITPQYLGIILYKEEKVELSITNLEIYRNAEKLNPLMKQEALTTALLKSI